jgi:hypothetical protein
MGGFHSFRWRKFVTDLHLRPSRGFVDGDLIESVLDLSRDKVERLEGGGGEFDARRGCKDDGLVCERGDTASRGDAAAALTNPLYICYSYD